MNQPRDRALEFLQSGLRMGIWPEGTRLPSIREMAKQARVAVSAMVEAVGILTREGRFTVLRSRGIVAGPISQLPAPRQATRKWERLKANLQEDVLSGHFSEGQSLPALGTLQQRYGVSYPTLNKALKSLSEEGLLIPDRREFKVARTSQPKPGSTVLFISAADPLGKVYVINDRFASAMHALEHMAEERRVELMTLGHAPGAEVDELINKIRSLDKRHRFLGFVLWGTVLELQDIRSLSRALLPFKRPISLFDEKGDLDLPADLSENRLLRVFAISGLSAGRAIGRHLLALGHRKVAFISHWHDEAWSVQRYQGLCEAFALSGLREGIKLFGITERDQISALETESSEVNACIHQLEPLFKELETVSQKLNTSDHYFEMRKNYLAYLVQTRLALALEPLFKQLLSQNQITAWVGVNDNTAILAQTFLRQSGKKAAQEISVVGFDDNRWSFEYGLSSWNFSIPEAARRMLSFIIRPESFKEKGREELAGFLVQRSSSTKMVRKSAP